jgi:hypothetical protein
MDVQVETRVASRLLVDVVCRSEVFRMAVAGQRWWGMFPPVAAVEAADSLRRCLLRAQGVPGF